MALEMSSNERSTPSYSFLAVPSSSIGFHAL